MEILMNPYDNAEALLRMLSAPRRNQYFYGKRMDVQHFQLEQDYGKLKRWMLNRLTLGMGVLCGLDVSIVDGRVCVDPGVAIDALGREIVVPVRACIDPFAAADPCCGGTVAAPAPAPAPAPTPAPTPAPPTTNLPPIGTHPSDGTPVSVMTLWLCYKECRADYEPALVSDCSTRDHCSAGTVVESFCLKVTDGGAPAQGDPDWCAHLWPAPANGGNGNGNGGANGDGNANAPGGVTINAPEATGAPLPPDQLAELEAALHSRRHLVCKLFDGPCDPPDGDPCVPLALLRVSDGKVSAVEECAVRPRVYSNAVLFDLILCLMARIDDCCGGTTSTPPPPPPPPPPPMRVKSVTFLRINDGEHVVQEIKSPLDKVTIKAGTFVNAIRVAFTTPFEQAAHNPTTAGLQDPDYLSHNVLVLTLKSRQPQPQAWLPGTLTIEAADTVRWDVINTTPPTANLPPWPVGQYQLALRGSDAGANRPGLDDQFGQALDGEPIAPNGSAISGDGVAGGDFTLTFTIA
jgi:hypothetical protein